MIPADVASRVQSAVDATVRPAAAAQEVSNVLSGLVSGQRVLAEIQAQLPNGAYRAIINQRDITLALPFSAKAGDSLELEVVDTDGKLALAVVSRRTAPEQDAKGERPAVETTLSRTGNFIAGLLNNREEGKATKPVLLNANMPIAEAPPSKGADLVPLLKQAITQSGMFYESHQSQWVNNQLPLETLLSQPQGRFSRTMAEPPTLTENGAATLAAKGGEPEAAAKQLSATNTPSTSENQISSRTALPAGQMVAPDLTPLVQQQLEALANQNYVWQGQAWPGQPMQWEIIEDNGGRQRQEGDAEQAPWQTRLTLTMPQLGEVRAALRISGGELTLSLSTQSNEAAAQLTNGSDTLRQQLETAGLKLNGFSVGRHDQPE